MSHTPAQDLKQRVDRTIEGFEETKKAYALPNSDVDIGEVYNYAWQFYEFTKELTEREEKLVEVVKDIANMTDCQPASYIKDHEFTIRLISQFQKYAKTTLKELGIE